MADDAPTEAHQEVTERRVAVGVALLQDRLQSVVGPLEWWDEQAARRLVADILEASS